MAIDHHSLTKTEAAFRALRQAIEEGAYHPGEHLRVSRLVQELDISPTPIREALRLLQSEGLVDHHAHRGAAVAEYSPEDAVEVYRLRAMLEPLAAELAAGRATPDEVADIRRLHDDAGRRAAGSPPHRRRRAQRRLAPRDLQRERLALPAGVHRADVAGDPRARHLADRPRAALALPARARDAGHRGGRRRGRRRLHARAHRARRRVDRRAPADGRAHAVGVSGVTSDELRAVIDDRERRAQVPAAELVEALLDRIERTHEVINAYITVDADGARAAAVRTDERRARGETLGPLDGMPLGIKDNIDVAGLRATRGSAFFADRVADEDAEVIRRLRAAGAIILGKVELHEFAFGATTDNLHFGPCRNPWDPDRVPGGSSGGSGAALGADLCVGALGSDTGGSVRIPAALNNVSALRPTHGLISTRGTFPIGAIFDTVGPMARSMRDVAQIFAAVAGYDRDDPNATEHPYADPLATLEHGVAGLRIGLPRRFFFEDLDPSVARSTEQAAEQFAALGAEVFDVDLEGASEAFAITNVLVKAEATGLHRERIDTEPDRFDPDVLRRLRLGDELGAPAVGRALEQMRAWRVHMVRVFDDVDLLLTPTTNAPAPRRQGDDMIAMTAQLTRFTYSWSLASMPAVSVPSAPHDNGMPLGVQLGAAPWQDATALRAGHALQHAADWHLRRPPELP